MRKILKISVLCCLLCCFMASTAYAGDSSFSKYDVNNTGHTFKSTGSSNTKATAGAKWFFKTSHYAQDIQMLCDEVYTIKSGKIVSKER